ncbi:MAG: bifunctional diguanylate cyclase/phosphodiesterase, partial [Pseudomonadota bacterium]
SPFSVLHIDLDHFKEINDTIGHAAGDAVLRHVSRALRAQTRHGDFVARAGGDEFVIVTPGLSDPAELSLLAGRIIAAVNETVNFRGDLCKVGASIGIDTVGAPAGTGPTSAERVLMNADIALYRAKEVGRACHVFFEPELRHRVEESKKLADDLTKALDRGEITCFYHPQHDPETLQICGAEALARWIHPERGVLSPEEFLATAERLSIVDRIDEIVLRKAIEDLARWDALGLDVEAVSVNVSSDRLKDPDLIEKLKRIDLPRGRLIFEILETAFVDELSDDVKWNIDSVRELGIEIEIDDFGTGKASILGVLALNPQRLKIAKEIVLPLPELESQRALVRAIVSLAKTLNVGLIAEGVETQEHLEILREMNFSKLQGYLLSRPMQADDIIELVRSTRAAHPTAALA